MQAAILTKRRIARLRLGLGAPTGAIMGSTVSGPCSELEKRSES